VNAREGSTKRESSCLGTKQKDPWPQDRQSSELVAKGYLDLTYRIDDVSGSIGYAEIVIGDIAIQRSEDMPVKGIGNIYLEY
jgi:hypothetical protein